VLAVDNKLLRRVNMAQKNSDSANFFLKFIDPDSGFSKNTMSALRDYRKEKPWEGSLNVRMKKIRELHDDLCRIYKRNTELYFDPMMYLDLVSGKSTKNYYSAKRDTIFFRSSVNTLNFLSLWGEVLYPDNYAKSLWWSLNLFRKVFPDQFQKLVVAEERRLKKEKEKKEKTSKVEVVSSVPSSAVSVSKPRTRISTPVKKVVDGRKIGAKKTAKLKRASGTVTRIGTAKKRSRK
jgi:hypothetical protein